jgi:hypothetical protein
MVHGRVPGHLRRVGRRIPCVSFEIYNRYENEGDKLADVASTWRLKTLAHLRSRYHDQISTNLLSRPYLTSQTFHAHSLIADGSCVQLSKSKPELAKIASISDLEL